MKNWICGVIALLLCGAVYAAQDTSITVREVRNPNELKAWLEANAADAESRLTTGSTNAATLALINYNDAGTSWMSMQADKADDAGDYYRLIATDGSGLDIQSDVGSKGVLATVASVENDGTLTTAVGLDGIGAVDMDYGSADITDHTFTSDGGTVVMDGSVTASGAGAFSGAVSGTDITAAGDLTVTTNATVGGTLAVTGVGTFTAESVHNGGVDADYITVDAAAGIDTKSAGALVVGAATATSLSLGASDIDTTVLGPLNVLEATGKGIDTTGAGALYIGEAVATSLVLGAADIDTTVLGPLNVLEATGKGIDTSGAGALYLGEAVATSVVVGASDADTTIVGDLTVSGNDIDSGAGAMTVGAAAATSLALGASDITTTINGTVAFATGDVGAPTNTAAVGISITVNGTNYIINGYLN